MLFYAYGWDVMTLVMEKAAPPPAMEVAPCSPDSVDAGIIHMINHPAKALALLALSGSDDTPQTLTSLHRCLNAAQGETPSWVWGGHTSSLRKFYDDALVTAGYVEVSEKPGCYAGSSVAAYSLTNAGRDFGVPLAGLALGAQLSGGLSLRRALGEANSKSQGALRGPLVR